MVEKGIEEKANKGNKQRKQTDRNRKGYKNKNEKRVRKNAFIYLSFSALLCLCLFLCVFLSVCIFFSKHYKALEKGHRKKDIEK